MKKKDHIFVLNQDKKEEESKTLFEAYTYSGEHDYLNLDDFPCVDIDLNDEEYDVFTDPNVFALHITKGHKNTYYVKRNKSGRLLNPLGLYEEGKSEKYMNHAGRPEWVLQPTNVNVFEYYINFLKTKNIAWINHAEREV